MTAAHAITRSLQRRGRGSAFDVGLPLITTAWVAFVVQRELEPSPLHLRALLIVPAVLIAIRVSTRGQARPGLTLATAIASTVTLAVLSTRYAIPSPSLVLGVPAVIVSAILMVRRPAAAIIVLFLLTGTFGSIAAFLSLSVAPLADLILGGLWLATVWAYFLRVRERPIWLWPGVALIMGFLALSAFQVLISPNVSLALRSFRLSAWYLMALLLLAYAPWFQAHRTRIARGFVLVALLVGAYATFRWLFGQSGTETAYSLSQSNNEVLSDGQIRLLGSFTTGKELALWTACLMPFCLACALTFSGRWRAISLAACGTCALAMFATDVRAGVVAVVPAVLVVFALYQGARGFSGLHLGTTVIVTALIAVMGVGAFALTLGGASSTPARYRVLITDPTNDPSYQARVFKWDTALRDIRHHPFGQGLGASGLTQKRFGRFANISSIDVDNSYLKVALEQGFAMMVFFILALVTLGLGLASRAVRTVDPERAGLAIGAVGTMIVLLIFMFTGTYIEALPVLAGWLVIGLGVAQFSSGAGAKPSEA